MLFVKKPYRSTYERGKTVKKTALGGRFVILGSGNWTRTSDIRIDSPFLIRLIEIDKV